MRIGSHSPQIVNRDFLRKPTDRVGMPGHSSSIVDSNKNDIEYDVIEFDNFSYQ